MHEYEAENFVARRRCVFAGGGATRVPRSWHRLFLDLSWDYWKEERLPLIVDSRPVLKNKTLEEVEQLFFQRQSAYALHHSRVVINELEAEQAADQIVESIKWMWDVYEPNR